MDVDPSTNDAPNLVHPVDELGRLLTAPGLCGLTSQSNSIHGSDAELTLTYDARGLPQDATTTLTPSCLRHDLPDYDFERPQCFDDIETQTLEWTWDADGNLHAIEHSVTFELGEDFWADYSDEREAASFGDRQCLVGEPLFVIQHDEWTYDESGRVAAWTETYADCDGAATSQETLRYQHGGVEVTSSDSSSARVKTFELDADGRVLVAEPWRYAYDLMGRLTEATHADGTIRSWNYEASLVAENGREWTREISSDRRRITLKRRKPEGKVVIWFDAEGRPEEVLSAEEEDWHLTYGGCPNAERSSTRWLVHQVLDAWPFPEEPQAGDALEEREAWRRGSLPLRPF